MLIQLLLKLVNINFVYGTMMYCIFILHVGKLTCSVSLLSLLYIML